jgi:hypothetical protein
MLLFCKRGSSDTPDGALLALPLAPASLPWLLLLLLLLLLPRPCRKGLKLDGSNPTLLYGYGEGSALHPSLLLVLQLCVAFMQQSQQAMWVATLQAAAASTRIDTACLLQLLLPPLAPCCMLCFSVHPVDIILVMSAVLLPLPGGFNISLEPGFSASRLAWLAGYNGVYAQVGRICKAQAD